MDVEGQAKLLIRQKDWSRLEALSQQLVNSQDNMAYGYFLQGLVDKARGKFQGALKAFERAHKIDRSFDLAGLETAELLQRFGQQAQAIDKLSALKTIPPGLHGRVGDIYSKAGLHALATSPYETALGADPKSPNLQMNLAGNLAKCGEIDRARSLYEKLLGNYKDHQRLHYDLAKLSRATDETHYLQMREVLDGLKNEDDKNIFLLFALGKTAEDLDRNEEAFGYYRRGNQAAATVAARHGYQVDQDIAILDAFGSSFTKERLTGFRRVETDATPIFIIGLPRSGTTLTEKILTGHSDIESIDESFFLENAFKAHCGLSPAQSLTPVHISKLSQDRSSARITEDYLAQSDYRRSGARYFIEKYPMNFLYAGLVARHMPQAKIICLLRNPMDVCFALFKQPHFRFSFELDGLARYYASFHKLIQHWRAAIPDQIHFVEYELLVENPDETVKNLMQFLGLDYSENLLKFHERQDVSASASSAQIREKLYSRSVGKWKFWERELAPLKAELLAQGINLSSAGLP